MRTVKLLRLLTRSALATLALLLIAGTSTALAKTIYVDTGGSDAFSGLSPAQPKLTIAGALAIAEEGDVISIEAGVYAENVTITIDNLTFESRTDGVFTTVVIDGSLGNAANGTQLGTSGDGDFEVTGSLTQTSGSLTIADLPIGGDLISAGGTLSAGNVQLAGDLVLADGAVTADELDVSGNNDLDILRAGGTLTANVVFPDDPIDVTYDGDADMTSGDELAADLNGGVLSVELVDDATLTLAEQVTVGTLNVDADAIVEGDVVVENNVTGTGTAGTVIASGSITIDDAITLTGTLDIGNGSDVTLAATPVTVGEVQLVTGGALDLDGNRLDVSGDFNRTGGAFTADGGSTLAFVGAGDANFMGGPNLAVDNLLIEKDGTVTFSQDVNVSTSFDIGADATADLGARTVTISGTGATVTNEGTFAQTEGILLFNSTADNSVLQGGGTYNSITVLVGAGSSIDLGSDVLFTGTLNLQQGGIDAQGFDISPTGDNAQVIVNLAAAGTSVTNGTFNDEENSYDLEYNGDLGGATVPVGSEFALGFVRNITVAVSDGEVDATAAAGGDIVGNLVLQGVSDVADSYTLLLPADDISVQGSLQVGANATVDTGADDTVALTLSGPSHSVQGLIVGSSTLTLEDTAIEITGSNEATNPAAELPTLLVAGGTAVTLTNIQVIDGDVTVQEGGSLALALVQEATVTGDFDVETDASVAFNSNVNYTGAFTAVEGASFSGTGTLVFAGVSTVGTEGEALPNVRVAANVTMTEDVAVAGALTEAGGVIDLGGFILTVGSSVASDGGPITTGAGSVVAGTTSVNLTGNAEIAADEVEVTGTLTVTSDGNNDVLTITADLALGGTLALGPNNVVLDGDLLNDEGTVTGTGTLIFMGGNIVPGDDITLEIPNLSVDGASTVVADGILRISSSLLLNDDLTVDEDDLVIAEGATVTLNADGPLANAPTFEGPYNLVIDVTQTGGSGPEVSSDVALNSLDVNAAYELNDDVTVNETVAVNAALTTAADVTLTLGSGATLILEDDPTAMVGGADLAATDYNIVYEDDADGPIGPDEIIDGATVTTITVEGADLTLDGASPTSFNNIDVNAGSFDMSGFDITVNGDLSFAAGNTPAFGNTGANSNLTFGGSSDGNLALTGNWTVPGSIEFVLDKDGTAALTLSGGDLDLHTNLKMLNLAGGQLDTEGNAAVRLFQDATTQGFNQTDPSSFVTGTVRKVLYAGDPFGTIPGGEPGGGNQRSARFEFPVGAPDGEYRPAALTFRSNIPTTTTLSVSHEDVSPQGTLGFPLTSGDVTVGNYPNFYWLMRASTSLGQAQAFDVELTGTQIGLPFEDVDDLRIIRRFDGDATTNAWSVQGSPAQYENFLSVEDGDTTAILRVTESSGGLVPQGARFTLGIPVRAPGITYTDENEANVPLTGDTRFTVDEGETLEVDLQYSAQDIGETATFDVVSLPEFVTVEDAEDGTATLTASPGFDDAGEYEVTLSVSDPTATTEITFTIEVNNVDRPLIVENAPADTVEVIALREFTFTITASDPDGGDITFELDPDTLGATLTVDGDTATFSFTPEFEQVGDTLDFTINVSDGADTVAVNFTLIVTEAELVMGDVSLNGEVSAFDAALVLQHVTGQITLSAPAQMVADVSDNGSISALDAALILQYDAEIIDCFPAEEGCVDAAKTIAAAAGELAWGTVETADAAAMLYIPVSLTGDVSNVLSVELTATIDRELAVVKSVSGTALPNGWQVAYAVSEEGQLRVALAGTTPLANAGEIARIAVELKDENAQATVTAEGRINENGVVYLGELAAREIPTEFELGSNYPNPFNPTTTFTYSLPENGMVTIQVFDITGRRVRVLVNEEKDAGIYKVQWDGRNDAGQQVASGMYLYQIRSGSFVDAKKMMLVK